MGSPSLQFEIAFTPTTGWIDKVHTVLTLYVLTVSPVGCRLASHSQPQEENIMVPARLIPIVFVVLALVTAGAATMRENAEQAASMTEAAQAFLDALTPEQRAATTFPFDGEDRFDWHYIPRERKGVALRTMSEKQQDAALALVRASLSAEGYDKAERIRQLEQILFEREGRAIRDPKLYFFMIFGEPAPTGTWAWRYEGHHISHSWTVVNGQLSGSTPQFFGTNPAHVREGSHVGEKVLAAEDYYARTLLGSLSSSLQSAAIISNEAPDDMLTSSDRQAAMQDDSGVAYDQLNTAQQSTLWSLIEEYAAAQHAPVAEERLEKVKSAGLDRIKFAWMGGTDEGEGHYYRVQGPTFLIEYDNVQNDANHVHSVWRDFDGDFGRDLLAAHYRQFPHRALNADE